MSGKRTFQLALSGKKTILRVKEPAVKFVRQTVIQHIEECADLEKIVYIPKLLSAPIDDSYPLNGENWYHADLFGKKAVESSKPSEGNVVIGFSTCTQLILDIDFQAEETVVRFAREYAKFHKLGSSLVLKTSDKYLTDLYRQRLGKYCVVFGKPISWEEIRWHIKEARRLGMIERTVVIMTRFGNITERANAKNDKTPPPKIVKFYANGDMRGIRDYVSFLNRNKDLGF